MRHVASPESRYLSSLGLLALLYTRGGLVRSTQRPACTGLLHLNIPRRGASQSSRASVLDYRIRRPGEELPCSTVTLAPIESLAKSSLDRVRCGAPLGLGGSAPQAKRYCAAMGGKIGISTTLKLHLMAPEACPERRISWWPVAWGLRGPETEGVTEFPASVGGVTRS